MTNMQRTGLGWVVAMLVGATTVAILPAVAGAQEARADLAGQWILNEDESDDPQEMMQARRGGGTQGRGGAGPGAGAGRSAGRGGMAGRGGEMGGRQGMEGMRDAMASAMKPPTQLRLTVEDEQVRIESIEGRSLVLPTNGDEVETTVNGRVVEMEAEWDDGNLKVERRIEGGVRVTESYARAPESTRMIVTVLMEGSGAATAFKLVYDRAADPVGN